MSSSATALDIISFIVLIQETRADTCLHQSCINLGKRSVQGKPVVVSGSLFHVLHLDVDVWHPERSSAILATDVIKYFVVLALS
jgi:hypothetical protein